MRVKLWNRFIIAFTGLLLLAAGVLLALCAVGFTPSWLDLSWLEGKLTETWRRVALCGGGVVLCLLGLHNVWMLFRGKKMKGFIMQRTDYGDVSISMKALETMVHKCVEQHQELEVKSTKIYRVKNGIVVQIRVLLETGVNIPLTVNALQKQIKQYIASCSGVDVHEVRVLVETGAAKAASGKEQQEIVVDNRKPTIIPEPIVIQKEEAVREYPPVMGEIPQVAVPVEEAPENFEEVSVAQETEEAEEFLPEEPAQGLEEEDALFEGFDSLSEDMAGGTEDIGETVLESEKEEAE